MYYIGIICGLLLLSWTFIHGRKNNKLPPGPMPLPLIGNLHNIFGAPPYKSMERLANKYGPIISLKLGRLPTVVISSSAAAKEAVKKHDSVFSSKTPKDAVEVHNHHNFSVVWLPVDSTRRKNLRTILNSCIFSANKLDANQNLRSSKISELIAYCHRCSQISEAVDFGLVAYDIAINVLSNTIFSADLVDLSAKSEKKFKDVIRSITYQIGKFNMVDYFPVLKSIDPQGINRSTCVSSAKMFRIFGDFIDERLDQREKNSQQKIKDVLDILLNMSEEKDGNDNNIAMDRNQIEHLCLDLFIAGTDSSSATLEWAMLELMKNPHAMEKAKVELAQVVGKKNAIKEADLVRLPYLHCILKETLRIHPPVPLLSRKAEQDFELCGYFVPKGSQVIVNIFSIGRDPAIWKDPLAFKPERFWGSNNMDIRGQDDFELIPFGVGRRMCPAISLAMRTVPIMLGSLLNSFDWVVEGDNDLDAEEKSGLIVSKLRPLRLVPISL
ncbi:geraniol 8-hydroxylase-like [Solanum dulcamara]|uniref:geraniol 8-hydroxylase-like n=1 Tax=Solanum dulcamara TaxID=45834 RepID=UPI0024856CB3|nr:geraniol 8-hydroxylase-like [Solanum dulcamara]